LHNFYTILIIFFLRLIIEYLKPNKKTNLMIDHIKNKIKKSNYNCARNIILQAISKKSQYIIAHQIAL
jgi:hypothetical protein